MSTKSVKESRLSPMVKETILPFVRAEHVEDASIYWMPVTRFPMRPDQRDWLSNFQLRLGTHLRMSRELREEIFLRFKSIYPDLSEVFSRTAIEFSPIMGGGIAPGSALPQPITMEALKQQVDEATEKGTIVDMYRWMPDITYWFAKKKPGEQRESFLGYGGLTTIYLKSDEATKPPVVKLPRLFTTSPGFEQLGEKRFHEEMDFAYSLRDPFLARSKEVFGEAYRNDPSYRGLLFVIPLFTAGALLQGGAEKRSEWLEVFDGYMTESVTDQGVLLLMNTPDFDDDLTEIVRTMAEDNLVYRD